MDRTQHVAEAVLAREGESNPPAAPSTWMPFGQSARNRAAPSSASRSPLRSSRFISAGLHPPRLTRKRLW